MIRRVFAIVAVSCAATAASAEPWRTWEEVRATPPLDGDAAAAEIAASLPAALSGEIAATLGAAAGKADATLTALLGQIPKIDRAVAESAVRGLAKDSSDGFARERIAKPNVEYIDQAAEAILGGVAKFVARRARDEATRYVLRLLDRELCTKLRASLPQTCAILGALGGARSLVGVVEILQRAIDSDLRRLPASLPPLLRRAGRGELACAAELGLLVHALRSPSASIVAGLTLAALETEDCGRALGLADRAAAARVAAPLRVVLALGLDADVIGSPIPGRTVAELIARHALNEVLRQPALADAVAHARALSRFIDDRLDELREAPETAATMIVELERLDGLCRQASDDLRRLADESQRRLVAAVEEKVAPLLAEIEASKDTLRTFSRLDEVDEAARALPRIAGAVGSILRRAAGERAAPVASGLEAVAVAAARLAEGDHQAGLAVLLASGLLPTDVEPLATLVQYAPLLGSLAAAPTSDEVASLLETVAAPAGSWSRKRRGATAGLSAQFGFAAGLEWADDASGAGALEAYLPVGLDLAVPLGGRWAGGLFLQILDLGAATSFRPAAPGTSEPELSLGTVFVPGALLYVGLGQSPFVLTVGASYVPGLVRVEGAERGALRVLGAVAVDVPILIF